MKRGLTVLLLMLFILPAASGQLWKLRRYELTAAFGTSQFMGDIGGFTPGENALGLKDLTIHNTRFAIGASVGYRFAFTDYLDGYTSQYSKHDDRYYLMTIVFTYKLKTSEKGLPSFRK